MRRRSERKKSTDVSSPPRRSGRRSLKIHSEKNVDEEGSTENKNRASSEEPEAVVEKSRRTRTGRKRNQHTESQDVIQEEVNNCAVEDESTKQRKAIEYNPNKSNDEQSENSAIDKEEKITERAKEADIEGSVEDKQPTEGIKPVEASPEQISVDIQQIEVIGNSRSHSHSAIVENQSGKISESISDVLDLKEDSQDTNQQDNIEAGPMYANRNQNLEENSKNHAQEEAKDNSERAKEVVLTVEETGDPDPIQLKPEISKSSKTVDAVLDTNENSVTQTDINSKEPEKSVDTNSNQTMHKSAETEILRTQRKRKWLTKKTAEIKEPVLAISTDSLKGLIADVQPVPLSDVRFDSSPEVEELPSEREEGEETPSPQRLEERQRDSVEKTERQLPKRTVKEPVIAIPAITVGTVAKVQRSPSPARNKTSCVLYITNLVRPFTVLQLKSLLARTGKIVDDGFWIDRIKSKCYVQYETSDEAIETRHALHGVRWPVSNPKCLNVDFGSRADMDRAIESTKEDAPKLSQDNKDNIIVGGGWNRGERIDEIDRKSVRPVREWDVGKKNDLEREKTRENEKRRSRERDRGRERDREREPSLHRENDKNNSDRKVRNRERKDRSRSLSPARKIQKKENEPPLRLLDDLFRKTKSTPCVYWLPLTPEQIAEKEAFRQKRIAEHKERVKQRELERETEREREREKERNRNDRDRNRDRRRSRSRDRRRY